MKFANIEKASHNIQNEWSDSMNNSKAEGRMREFAEAGNFKGIQACIELAMEYPEGHVARKLEVIGTMALGLSLFDNLKSDISFMHDMKPSVRPETDTESAKKSLGDYEQYVTNSIKTGSEILSYIVGDEDTDELTLRNKSLQKLKDEFSMDENNSNNFARKALLRNGLSIKPDDARKAISLPFSWIKENLWSTVTESRHAEAYLSQGHPPKEVVSEFAVTTDESLGFASSIATDAIMSINKIVEDDR